HIIDSETSFNALLGRPWLHEYRMVPSSLHQCIKYMLDGEEHCIKGDIQPFSVHEVGIYEDAAYYLPKKHVIFSRGINTSTTKEDPQEKTKYKNKRTEQNAKIRRSCTKILCPSGTTRWQNGSKSKRSRERSNTRKE
ncbi:hypothetical protein, partial [Klebsiella pneumoniae]|uniref:hypothetical protein n=1 Tax=Klebsiella pneumoniae TaxID=573 RepID=UPI001D0E182F